MAESSTCAAWCRPVVAVVALAGAIGMLHGCGKVTPAVAVKGPVAVTVLPVVRKDVPIAAVYVAQTQSSQAVNIQARVSGFLDKRVYVEGSVVKAGQILFQMDQKPFQAQVDAQSAAMQRNQAALQVASQNLARTKPLAQQNALSQKDLDDAQGQYEQSAAAVEQSKAQLEEAKLNLSYTTIRSPVDGVSSFAVVADGTYLNPQNAQLTTVSVLSPMWINFSVSENQMQRIRNEVKSGQLKLPDGGRFVVTVELVDGALFPYTGQITFADPSYNSATGTFLLRATVANPDGVLRPNQYVRTRLSGAIRPGAIVVPQRAVQQSAKGHFVWLVDKQSQAQLRPVTVGEWDGDGWLIAEGLDTGDQVVVDGGVRLTPGAPVKAATYVPPPAPVSAVSTVTAAGKPPPVPTSSAAQIFFPTGRYALDATALAVLRTAAASHMGSPTTITITGYADATGNAMANGELARQRALAVRDALVQSGIPPERIRLAPPANVTGAGSNDQARRVDIAVKP